MKKLLKAYENHIYNFIKTMEKNPIKINTSKINSMTTRQKLFSNSSDKIIDKKGFSFKKLKTDKERIKPLILNKEMKNDNVNRKRKDKNMKLNLKKIFLDEKQDNKYKEDIKKLFKIFNNYNHELNNEEKLLYEHFKHKCGGLTFNNLKIIESGNDEKDMHINNLFYDKKDVLKIINNTSINEEDKYKKLLHNKIYNDRKNMVLLRKLKLKYIDKIKKLNKANSNLFLKTNFKAMENLTLFKSPIIKHKINKTFSAKEINIKENNKSKNIFNNTISKFNNKRKLKNNNENNFKKYSIDINLEDMKYYNNNKNNFKIFGSKILLSDISLRKEIAGMNPLLFQYNVNHIKNLYNKNEKDSSFNDKIISLKKMAFEKKDNSENEIKYEKSFYEMVKQNENILIDGEKYQKNDLDIIADRLLKKCNWKPILKKQKRNEFDDKNV